MTPFQWAKSGSLGVLLVLTAHLASACNQSQPSNTSVLKTTTALRISGTVIRAVDGDTLKIGKDYGAGTITVRLLGVDTPETHDPRKPVQCYGPQSSNFTSTWAKGHVLVTTEPSTGDVQDRYGRTLGYVYVFAHRRDLGATLLRRGFARVYAFHNRKFKKRAYYEKLQSAAQAHRLGRWGHC